MSVRPQEAAESASRFSLRQVFSSVDASPASVARAAPPPPAPPTAATFAPPPAATIAAGALLPAAATNAAANSGLKFTLPQMRGGQTTSVLAAGHHGARNLQAGFLSGGTPHTTQETLRLNGIIADLHAKLAASQERLATAERAVARGSKAISNERTNYTARINALSTELRMAQERETAIRAELATVPRQAAFDVERFKIQAEGAVQLQTRYDDAVLRSEELEKLVAETNGAYDALKARHAALEETLVAAQLAAEAAEAKAGVSTGDCADDHDEPASEDEETDAADNDVVEIVESDYRAAFQEALAEAAVVRGERDEAKEQSTALADTVALNMKKIDMLEASVAEADGIIKSNDRRIWEITAERDAALAATSAACAERDKVNNEMQAALELHAEDQAQIERMTAASLEADEAAQALEQAGTAATAAMRADVGRKRMLANRLRRSLETGEPAAAVVTFAVGGARASATPGPGAARRALATGMNLAAGCFGTSAPALEDSCGLNLHTVTAAQCFEAADGVATAALRRDDEEALTQQQMRVNELVQCISTDLKWTLTRYATAFQQRAALAA